MKNEKKLRILAAGDLHGDEQIAEDIAKKAEKEKVDLVVLAGDLSSPFKKGGILGPFKKRNLETLFVPGNWDNDLDAKFFREIYGIKNLDGYYFSKGNVDFVGIGNPNFKLDHSLNKDFLRIKESFNRIKSKKSKKVLVSHLHPAGTKAEFSGIGGSMVLRKSIEYFKPDIVICSHIHEAEGIEDRINKTKIFQVGSRGRIIEI
jgi:uncharacterized protein